MFPMKRFHVLLGLATLALMYSSHADTELVKNQANRPVEKKLKQMADESGKVVPPEILAAGEKGLKQLIESGITKTALTVGDTAPSFNLPDAHGKIINSRELLAKGPVVLVFYRGAWCPFCNLYLSSLRPYVSEFETLGATLVAVSGESPDRSLEVSQGDSLNFHVLSDTGLVASRKFGIVYEVPAVIQDAVLKLGFDMKKYYNTSKAELPLSATYLIDKKGKIEYAFLEPDYKLRAEPEDLIAVLKKLK